MRYSKLFVTGCDYTTEWQLPWFIENFRKHNPDANLVVFNFGMSDPELALGETVVDLTKLTEAAWFKKPKAMLKASELSTAVCWIDTDCEVRANIDSIFDHLQPNKLAMCVDYPWSNRRGETWHNSGVVAFGFRPNILDEWAGAVSKTPVVGDQEVLHILVREGIRRDIHITSLPREYNVLRIDLVDGTAPPDIKIMHWTGRKGNDAIEEMMNND